MQGQIGFGVNSVASNLGLLRQNTGFLPYKLSGCVFWYESFNPANYNASTGVWLDLSPSGNNTTSNGSNAVPIYTANVQNGYGALDTHADNTRGLVTARSLSLGPTLEMVFCFKNISNTAVQAYAELTHNGFTNNAFAVFENDIVGGGAVEIGNSNGSVNNVGNTTGTLPNTGVQVINTVIDRTISSGVQGATYFNGVAQTSTISGANSYINTGTFATDYLYLLNRYGVSFGVQAYTFVIGLFSRQLSTSERANSVSYINKFVS